MNCYVANPKSDCRYPSDLNKDNTLFYPESSMTTYEQCTSGRPAHFHIVTDSIFLVPLYDRKNVFVWKDGEWINPNFQTYGASFNLILDDIFNVQHTIPIAVVNGKTTNVMGRGIKNTIKVDFK
jgi:hypothetical protein